MYPSSSLIRSLSVTGKEWSKPADDKLPEQSTLPITFLSLLPADDELPEILTEALPSAPTNGLLTPSLILATHFPLLNPSSVAEPLGSEIRHLL
ncbi:hypothetical protein ZOSMA_3473G00010, partial [Zostera marina]